MNRAWLHIIVIMVMSLSGARAESSDPQWQKPWEKGKEAYYKGDYGKAVAYFKEAAKSGPENGDVSRWLGLAYYKKLQYKEAIEACKRSIKLPHTRESESESWIYMGLAQEGLGLWNEAVASFEKGVELEPGNYGFFVALSRNYLKVKRYDDAVTAAKRAVAIVPTAANALDCLGAAYGSEKKYDEALESFKKAIQLDASVHLDSGGYVRYGWLGFIYDARNEYPAALEAYQKAYELEPNQYSTVIGVTATSLKIGRFEEAIAVVNKAIALETYTGIGITETVESGYPIVKEVFAKGPAEAAGLEIGDKIVRIDGKSTEGLSPDQFGQALKGALGTKVVLAIEKRGSSEPIEMSIVRENLVGIRAAKYLGIRSLAYRYTGRREEALGDAEKAYSRDPKDKWACLSLAASCLDTGRYEETIKLLSPLEGARSRLLESAAAFKQGKTQSAIDLYRAIPEEDMPPQNVMLAADRAELLKLFKPLADDHRAKARLFELKKEYREALAELSEALKIVGAAEVEPLRDALFGIALKNSSTLTLPEDARKHALRGELRIKDGNFGEAAKEYGMAIRTAPYAARLYYNLALVQAEMKSYTEAISTMKIYLKAAPDAPDAQAAKDEIVKWEYAMEKEKGR